MAGRSQHLEQIMENQTRFDLNAAIESWRQELATQANLTAEVRRELETHLRDSLAGFQQRGLNEEESFWLARRRVGQPQQLGEEFAKADPAKVWRERIFFIAVALLVIPLWMGLASNLAAGVTIFIRNVIHIDLTPAWADVYFPWWAIPLYRGLPYVFFYAVLSIVPTIWVAVLLTRGRINRTRSALLILFKSRRRFLFVSTALFLICCSWCIFVLSHVPVGSPDEKLFRAGEVLRLWLTNSIWPAALVALIAWLLPTQNRKTPKRA
jgi:hypothetical protein